MEAQEKSTQGKFIQTIKLKGEIWHEKEQKWGQVVKRARQVLGQGTQKNEIDSKKFKTKTAFLDSLSSFCSVLIKYCSH